MPRWLALVGLLFFLAAACGAVAQPSAQTSASKTSASPTATPWTRCSRVALSADSLATVTAGRTVVFTATAFGCSPADYRFILVHTDTGDWMITQGWDPSPTWIWDTSHAAPGPYSIVADARPRYEPGDSPDASISYPFSVIAAEPPASGSRYTSPPPPPPPAKGTNCTSVALQLSTTGPITPGTHVTATATPAGCASAEYRFVLVDPNGVGLFMQDWSASNTWTWDSSGAGVGQYFIEVDVRAYGVASTNPDATARIEVDVIHIAPSPAPTPS